MPQMEDFDFRIIVLASEGGFLLQHGRFWPQAEEWLGLGRMRA